MQKDNRMQMPFNVNNRARAFDWSFAVAFAIK